MTQSLPAVARIFREIGRDFYTRGWVLGTSGNFSTVISRKPLKLIIEADTEFQAKLRALKDAADIPAEEVKTYEFTLSNAIDTLDSSAEEHRQLLADMEEAAKHKKK